MPPPDVPIPVVDGSDPGAEGESETMAGPIDLSAFPTIAESGNLQMAASAMLAAATRRVDGADFLAENMRAMWGNAYANPTSIMAKALQTMGESGSGRTRAETNMPGNTAAPNITIEKQT